MGTCYNSTVVPASIDQVWEKIKNFHDLSWAIGMDLNVQKIGDEFSKKNLSYKYN